MGKVIINKCDVKDYAKYTELLPFQGNLKDLKDENFHKLRKEIINEGFAAPIYVWDDNGIYHILDGHQRVRVIKHLVEQEGYEDFTLPIVRILDDSLEKAKKRLLSYVSMYGTLTNDGLYEFMFDAKIEMQELEDRFSLPQNDFDIDKFKAEYFVNTDGVSLPNLSSENPEFQTISFVLSNKQKILLDLAIAKAKKENLCDDELNKNVNGNALAIIVGAYANG